MDEKEFDAEEFYAQAKEGIDYFEDKEGLRHDIKERDPKYIKIIKDAEKEAEENINREGQPKLFMGRCHMLWGEMQDILKNKHGIDWKTPAEMNPNVMFD